MKYDWLYILRKDISPGMFKQLMQYNTEQTICHSPNATAIYIGMRETGSELKVILYHISLVSERDRQLSLVEFRRLMLIGTLNREALIEYINELLRG